MIERKSVEIGYCVRPDLAAWALTRLECDDPANFRSSRQIEDEQVPGQRSGHCRWADSVRCNILGLCYALNTTTPTQCASQMEACSEWDLDSGMADPGSGFVDNVPECRVGATSFGRCDDGMCVWSPEQCSDDTSWTPFDEDCTCDKVQVGACSHTFMDDDQSARAIFCAVSEHACDAEQTWIVPHDVKTIAGFDCFLCREEFPPSDFGSEDNVFISISSLSFGIVLTIAGAIAALSLVGLIGWMAYGRTTCTATKQVTVANENAVLPSSITIPSNAPLVKMFASGHNADIDNDSVLSDSFRL